jgi:hypothetical protein
MGICVDNYYPGDEDDPPRTGRDKATDCFLYTFVPCLCVAFDVGLIVVGLICLIKSPNHDFSVCGGDCKPASQARLPPTPGPWIHPAMLLHPAGACGLAARLGRAAYGLSAGIMVPQHV